MKYRLIRTAGVVVLGALISLDAVAQDARVVALIAGEGSHGYAEHEHYAGLRLLADILNESVKGLRATAYRGWPDDPKALEDAAAVVIFADGGPESLLVAHIKHLETLMKRGAGLGVMHWALDVPKGPEGERMLSWLGGCYETNWSVNPWWTAHFESLPAHPVTRGVEPFDAQDEWYYHMRFRENMEGVTPILTALPPDSTRDGPDGPHSGNAAVRARKGMPEHLAWAYERKDGGRGFGFAGGHVHWNWAQDDYRKLVLNAVVWLAGLDVPAEGVASETPTVERLLADQDQPRPAKWTAEYLQTVIRRKYGLIVPVR